MARPIPENPTTNVAPVSSSLVLTAKEAQDIEQLRSWANASDTKYGYVMVQTSQLARLLSVIDRALHA